MTRRTFTDADLGDLSFHDVRVLGSVALRERNELRFDLERPVGVSFEVPGVPLTG